MASFQYELSPSSETAPKIAVDDQSLTSPDSTRLQFSSDPRISEQDAQKYWKENGVTSADLERWTINIRRWLHGTIVRRVVEEITSVNSKILETSEDAALIGSTTLNTLEQLAFSKYRHISTLSTLIRFLNCTKDQGYLVSRLRELARGSFLEEFRWDGGSKSTTSPWKEHIPTDTVILLHLLSTYMDCRLPPHPKCLSGRSFDQLHVVRHPDKPDLKAKYTAQLYISRIQPPVIKVVLDSTIYVFPSDQRNFYHALLMFFYFYHKQEDTIRSISLGASGLNLSWVFEK
ncbi:unnamed protein product [Schistocephalus solidus]|uniref:SAM domain-containing protein n=1 Tax=Schistocephalus solidus TaxID=70667 RepID=A0A183TH59_SCHSO|nr:unnamed protein product [Schistocephalus solidus]